MKTVVNIPLKINARVKVDVGQKIEKGDTIASNYDDAQIIEINLSEILKVKPGGVFKYLKKKPSEEIMKNEILAQKKSFMTTLSVRSPIAGAIKQIDLTKGTILIKTEIPKNSLKITSPVSGLVKSIGENSVEIEIQGTKIKANGGSGADIYGELYNVGVHHYSIFEIGSEVEDKIVMINSVAADLMAKLDTLGSKGIISEKVSKYPDFPYLLVSSQIFKELGDYHGKTIWMRPGASEVIIIED